MEGIRQYILSVVAVSIVCSLIKKITGKGTAFAPLIQIICGLFIALTALSPWITVNFADLGVYSEDFYAQAQEISDHGKEAAEESLASIITEQAETYILDKAISLGINVSVEVDLDENGQVPSSVIIRGDVSPYAKNALSRYIESTLAVAEESQLWM